MSVDLMRPIFYFIFIFLLSGCATQYEEGVPSNSFPRHQLNFLFNEGLVLDYSELDADDWRMMNQDVQGRYASTTFIPKEQSDSDWTQKFIVAFYPKITMPKQNTLEKAYALIEQSNAWSCLKDTPPQPLSSAPEEMIVLQQGSHCDAAGNQMYQIIRLVKTEQGVHQLSYLERGLHLDPLQIDKYLGYLKQAQVIKKRERPTKK